MKKKVQTGEKAQLALTVLEGFRQRKSTFDCGANLIGVPPGKHRRHCKGFLKNHLLSGTAAGAVECGQRPFTPTSAFLQQRQSEEQGRRPGGEFDAHRDIATLRQCPFERRPHVADMRSILRKIIFTEQ